MINTKASADSLWRTYKTLSKLADNELLINNNHPVDSIAWHQQNARHEAYHQATMTALHAYFEAC